MKHARSSCSCLRRDSSRCEQARAAARAASARQAGRTAPRSRRRRAWSSRAFRRKSAWPFVEASAAASAGDSFDPSAVTKRNYYVVLDASGSMDERKCSGDERKIDVAKRALLQFAQIVPADANLGVLVFDEQRHPSRCPDRLRSTGASCGARSRAVVGRRQDAAARSRSATPTAR